MDITAFKLRNPTFTNDAEIAIALSDAETLITGYCIADSKMQLAHSYLTAHLLAMPKGATEGSLTGLKAGSVELAFSDKHVSSSADFLDSTSYGVLFKQLVTPEPEKLTGIGYFVV